MVVQDRQHQTFYLGNTDADKTLFVCNRLTGQLFRLLDIDGTKKPMFFHNVGIHSMVNEGGHPRGRSRPHRLALY
ncbi:hypothetical protein ACP70R_035379 [Stipagrostis hirtigluma subsp. patula]